MSEVNLEMVPLAALAVDLSSGVIVDANSVAAELLAGRREDVVGRLADEFILDWSAFLRHSAGPARFPRQFAARSLRVDGRTFQGTWRVGAPEPSGVALVVLLHHPSLEGRSRRADSRGRSQNRNRSRVDAVDYLTGLANRWTLESLVESAMAAPAAAEAFGLLLVDLDDFKRVNDRYGHVQGDRVLAIIADRLVANVRPSDMVTRYGGDEFIVYADPVCSRTEMHGIAERIVAAIREPITLPDGVVEVSASVGVASGAEAASLLGLVEIADRAMYAAKNGGGNRFYDRDCAISPDQAP